MKSIFVLWSGGVDSTYLVQRCCEDPQYDVVVAGYVRVANNAAKAASELDAIARMLPVMQRWNKLLWKGVVLDVDVAQTNPRLAYKQIPIWLFALVEAVHFPVDEVAIGYIQGTPGEEDAATHIPDLERIWDAYRPLMHRDHPRLVFPLAGMPKREIVARIDPELRALAVYCEQPLADGDAFRACGKCRLCVQRREQLGG